jgi:hypothetical protein
MPFATSILSTLHTIRAIPGQMGLRPHRVELIAGEWSGEYVGRGERYESSLRITEAGNQNPKVRSVNDEEIALGQLSKGGLVIGPITPAFTGGGTDLTLLQAAVNNGDTKHLLVTGPLYPTGARFRIVDIGADHAMHYTIRAEAVSTDGPVE